MKAIIGSVFPAAGDFDKCIVVRDDITYVVEVGDDPREAEEWADAAAGKVGGGWVIPDLFDGVIVYRDPA